MTPRELAIIAEVRNEQIRQQQENMIVQAHMVERFHRMKRLPSLKKILEDTKAAGAAKQPQTPQQMLAVAMQLQAKFEGQGG